MTNLIEIASAVASTGTVTQANIFSLRQTIFADGIVSRAEAEALFAVERARTSHNDAWSELFVEALSDYALRQELPVGYVSSETASWIEAQIKRRKQPSMDADMALVVELIEKARDVPPAFSAFALRLAKEAVVYGDGVDERGRMHKSGSVDAADVALLQRILWGAGSEGQLAISREEAEALVAIADATAGADNVPEFDDLFSRAIGNYLIGATGRDVPSRQDALQAQMPSDHRRNVLGTVQRMLSPTFADLKDGAKFQSLTEATFEASEAGHRQRNAARAAVMVAAEVMTSQKASWLLDHVGKNGVTTGPERALLRFIARESSALDGSLKDVMIKVA